MRREVAHALAPWYERGAAHLSDTIRTHIEAGREIDADGYFALLDAADAMRRAFEHAMRPYDAALTPAAPGAAPEGLAFTGSRAQTMLWTMLGVPAVNVPVLVVDGLPLGLQIVRALRRRCDDAARGGLVRRPLAGSGRVGAPLRAP